MTYPYTSKQERAALFERLTKDCYKKEGIITLDEKAVFSLSCKYSPLKLDEETGEICMPRNKTTCQANHEPLVPCFCYIGWAGECLSYEPKEEE